MMFRAKKYLTCNQLLSAIFSSWSVICNRITNQFHDPARARGLSNFLTQLLAMLSRNLISKSDFLFPLRNGYIINF